jgi:hypothetical protein
MNNNKKLKKMNDSKKLKAIVFSMGLGVAMLTSTSVQAQLIDQRGGRPNGLFQESSQNVGLMQRGGNRTDGSTLGLGNEAFGAAGSQIDNEPFGAPLGGGIGILLAAGAGYALIQSKKNKQN